MVVRGNGYLTTKAVARVGVVLLLFIILIIYGSFSPEKSFSVATPTYACIEVEQLNDISTSKIQPKLGQSIFFIESSTNSGGLASLRPRQACAIESAAKWNPNRDIVVLFLSPFGFPKSLLPHIDALVSYQNIHFRRIDYDNFAINTPAEEFVASKRIFKSKFLTGHLSDLFRLLTLYKYGGVYFDLDEVSLKSLEGLPREFIVSLQDAVLGNAVLAFSHEGLGHDLLGIAVREFCTDFEGESWNSNGPHGITKVFEKFCNVTKVEEMTPEKCQGFHVLPPESFYGVPGPKWREIFESGAADAIYELIQNSTGVHVWNHVSQDRPLPWTDSSTAYNLIAKMNCPTVFKNVIEYF